MPPPFFKRSAPFVVEALNDCTWIGLKGQQFFGEQNVGESSMLQVAVDASPRLVSPRLVPAWPYRGGASEM